VTTSTVPESTTRGGSPVPDRQTVVRREIMLHGQPVTFSETGADSGGPVVVLLHGLASSSQTWAPALPLLGRTAHVIAPDLLGHGRTAKPRSGDYSLGAYAAGLRDLLVALGLDRATIVGHSFGGGVAMQFAYQFPEFTERLVLVASGGLGRDVALALRAATLPGTAVVLQLASALTPEWMGRLAHRALRAAPSVCSTEIDGLADAFRSFADRGARGAFAQTVRGALNWSGQRLDSSERLYLLAEVPVMLVAGGRDSVIPAGHTRTAHALIPGSRLDVFDDAGHFPHVEHPHRFVAMLAEFIADTVPARGDLESLRARLRRGHADTDRAYTDRAGAIA
jgi:pimeloyl-ACP methyl ester carboxylesterase